MSAARKIGFKDILIEKTKNWSLPMKVNRGTALRSTLVMLLSFLLCMCAPAASQENAPLVQKVKKIQTEIEEIRGQKFKRPIAVQNQSLADFGRYIDAQMSKQYPDEYLKNYGKVVKILGLYRGPEIEDYRELAKMVVQSQAAAYYDPPSNTFYVVMQNLPEMMLHTVFAHELYHGFQDQHFNLDGYYVSQGRGKLNDDELLARQAVVEGEATYVMMLWSLKQMFGQLPDAAMLDMSIKMQANMSIAQLLEMVKSGAGLQAAQGDMQQAVQAMDDIPPFMLETMLGAYLKGLRFVYAIQKHGWQKVAELYTTPPVSSEQILHPEKWLSGEIPVRIVWPHLADAPLFKTWHVLEQNTLGELQWRIIFAEHEMRDAGMQAAAGWQGDRYAVLQHNQDGQKHLLLMATAWDSDADAVEFKKAYEKLLKVKYPRGERKALLEQDEQNVYIVESDGPEELRQYVQFMRAAQPANR